MTSKYHVRVDIVVADKSNCVAAVTQSVLQPLEEYVMKLQTRCAPSITLRVMRSRVDYCGPDPACQGCPEAQYYSHDDD
jgi:hypothetical protein